MDVASLLTNWWGASFMLLFRRDMVKTFPVLKTSTSLSFDPRFFTTANLMACTAVLICVVLGWALTAPFMSALVESYIISKAAENSFSISGLPVSKILLYIRAVFIDPNQ
jgi:hypothetical protein